MVQRRPSTDPDQLEATQKTLGVATLPFRLTNIAATFQDALRGKFADQVGDVHPLANQITDQPPLAVNMLHVGRSSGASL